LDSIHEKHKDQNYMKIFIAPIVIATLAFGGTSAAVAQTKPGAKQGTSVGMAPIRDAAAERESYRQKAQGEMRIWQQKLYDFDAMVPVKATEAETRAAKDLDSAWTETKTASARLETAGEKDWDSAKVSFKTASDKLDVAWRKLTPIEGSKPSH
jgi:hypothetical protein